MKIILNYRMDEKIVEIAKEIVDAVEKNKSIYDAIEETVKIIEKKLVKK
tara:strand:+ start:313 stop:459 length:147 start_codon:yes stop_codon:yes gene_type:complete